MSDNRIPTSPARRDQRLIRPPFARGKVAYWKSRRGVALSAIDRGDMTGEKGTSKYVTVRFDDDKSVRILCRKSLTRRPNVSDQATASAGHEKHDRQPSSRCLHPFCSAVADDDDELWEICGNCGATRDYREDSQDYCESCETPWCMSAGYGSKLRDLCDSNDGRVPIGDDGRLDLPNAENQATASAGHCQHDR